MLTPSSRSIFFFFNDTATTEIYTLSLHDALPICVTLPGTGGTVSFKYDPFGRRIYKSSSGGTSVYAYDDRSEEHTSELQSPCKLVCRLLLEKKKKNT